MFLLFEKYLRRRHPHLQSLDAMATKSAFEQIKFSPQQVNLGAHIVTDTFASKQRKAVQDIIRLRVTNYKSLRAIRYHFTWHRNPDTPPHIFTHDSDIVQGRQLMRNDKLWVSVVMAC